MFLSICNETLGLTSEQILDSDFVLLVSILRERNYTLNERNKQMNGDESGAEYVNITDFETGETKQVKKTKSV